MTIQYAYPDFAIQNISGFVKIYHKSPRGDKGAYFKHEYDNYKLMTMRFLLSFLLVSGVFLPLYAQNYHGIDVSHHQHKIEWSKVAEDDVDFVYIKATEGATYKDPRYDENMKGAIDAGLPAGAYHFFRMTSSATAQFNNFRAALEGYDFKLVPMIDVETSDGRPARELQDSLDVFIRLLKDEYGCVPMIYGTQRSYNTYCAPKYNRYHLYIGRYGKRPPEIIGKGTYTIWQYTETGHVKGILKPVDRCVFNSRYGLKDIMREKY